MKLSINIHMHVRFLFCLFLYFWSSNNPFCYARNGDYLSHSISLVTGNNRLTTPKIRTDDLPKNNLIFNVLHYGARGDGITNDAKAFIATWNVSCKTKGAVMLVPSGFTFLLQTINFDGSECQPNIILQVDGKIMAPSKQLYGVKVKHDLQWILFTGICKGITIKGQGTIDGFGESWWNTSQIESTPHAMRIEKSSNIRITGITIQNSPLMHIYIEKSEYVSIHNVTVRSPGHSPNTDGIHISRVQHVLIHNTTIACGDDCVSIQNGSSNVKIYDVKCGPGHGYSIGGLGPNLEEAHVSNIAVLNSTVQDAMTGVRIKTWPGGYGSVRNVVFSNIRMSNVGTPIVIDQFYCGGHTICNVTDMNAVAISNVTYKGITGTYSYKPVSLACSYFHPCTNLTVAAVDLVSTRKSAACDPYCLYAYGRVLTNTTLPLDDCLEPQLPPSRPHALPPSKPPSPQAVPPSTAPSPAMPHHPRIYCRRPDCTREHAPPPTEMPTAAPPSTSTRLRNPQLEYFNARI